MARPRIYFPLEEAKKLYSWGASISMIARYLRYDRELVRRRLKEAGVQRGDNAQALQEFMDKEMNEILKEKTT